MKIAGVNLGETTFKKKLKDGSLCIVDENDTPTVFVEERLCGIKHAGGFERSFTAAKEQGLLERLDMLVVSTCCEPVRNDLDQLSQIFGCEAISVNHHLSHAHQVFHSSRFKETIIIVSDAGGNTLEGFDNRGFDWWKYNREQLSVFLANDQGINLLDRHYSAPYEIGPGEFWRYMTYFCGFDSSSKAAKVMELAGFGNPKGRTYFFDGFNKNIPNLPPDKNLGEKIVLEYFGRTPDMRDFQNKIDIAAWAQRSLEQAYEKIARHYAISTNQTNLCLAGGVALNCKLIQKLRSLDIFNDIYSGYAPSDRGQSLGNAIYGKHRFDGTHKSSKIYSSPFLGPHRYTRKKDIELSLKKHKNMYINSDGFDPSLVLKLLEHGFVVGTCVGRGEVGARALGNTSLLAMPNTPGIKQRLNNIKNREKYTPVASAVDQKTHKLIFGKSYKNYEYMAELVRPKSEEKILPSAIVHADKTVRVQLISGNSDCYLRSLEAENNKKSVPTSPFIILNTSFNLAGRAMPHSSDQAIEQFQKMDCDCMLLSGETMLRRKTARLEANIEKFTSTESTYFDIDDIYNSRHLIEKNFGSIEFREKFSLFENYIDWMRAGRKVTTIRYIQDGVSLPVSGEIPLIKTSNFKQTSLFSEDFSVKINGVKIKKFCELNQLDAQRDGFEKTSHLKRTLLTIYNNISSDSYVSINFIELVM
ncbi:carbamoyltransferase C-terminal domain-containing protein [uncultured Cohaesibacter sp.]|uniref:carbamoyltransferase C-terminal domain-containing protein n=1 Tax=uncultured Cohaesibacter sp. TaxID=1002546 RepID=UPI0029C95F6F|nr:carbamoyltransferase C-terminal domain-containing protein [uncultured Cohaesibacter sp.]